MLRFFKKKLKKKKSGNIIILHPYTKNINDMIYIFRDTESERLKLVILGHFLPINSPLRKNPKKQNFEKK